MSQADGADHVLFPAAAGDQHSGQTGQPAAVKQARIGGSQDEQPGQQPAALQPECPVERWMLGSQPQYVGHSPPRLRQEGAPGCLLGKSAVPPGSQSQPLVRCSALQREGWPPGCLPWETGVALGSQPRHAEQYPAGGKQQQGPCVELRSRRSVADFQPSSKAEQELHSEKPLLKQKRRASCNTNSQSKGSEETAGTSTWQHTPPHAGVNLMPGPHTAARSGRPLRARLALLGHPCHSRASRVGRQEEPLSTNCCPLSSCDHERGIDQSGGTSESLRDPLKERSVHQQQCASEFRAGLGTDEARQRSVSRSGSAMQCCESKQAGGEEQHRPVLIRDELGGPYLPGAYVVTSSSCMMQAQQRERRQYTPRGGEAALDLDTLLWRRKQRRRNGVQYLWDRAVQAKDNADIGKVKVEP